MPNGLRSKLSKLRFQGKITQEEYKDLIKKLEGHDEAITAQIKWERDTAINQLEMTEIIGEIPPRYLMYESLHPKKKPRGSIRRKRRMKNNES